MSETTTTDTPATDQPELGDAGKKAIATEREARKAAEKALADAQAKWEAERATLSQQLTEATESATKSQVEAARVSVFRDKGIPKELEKFVQGASAEELAASADEVLAAFHPAPAASDPTPGTKADAAKPLGMRPDMTQGATDAALNGDELEQSLRAAVGIA